MRANSAASCGEQLLQRAGEQDDHAPDHDDHVAGDVGLVEGELGAALVEHAEQQRGEHDADRMDAPHQRDGDADEAVAGGEIEQQPVLHAHQLVDRESARRARPRSPWRSW